MSFFTKKTGRKRKADASQENVDPLEPQEYTSLLQSVRAKHIKEKAVLISLNSLFAEWVFQLKSGFSILLYGFGSKRGILESFSVQCSHHHPVLEVDGSSDAFDVDNHCVAKLHSLCSVKRNHSKPKTPPSVLNEVISYFNKNQMTVTIVIFNFDGKVLRDRRSQKVLAFLKSSCPQGSIRIIASMDKMNSTLLWDQNSVSDFHWIWKDVTTFAPYDFETDGMPIALVNSKHGKDEASRELKSKGALHVLDSLNLNAKKIFVLLGRRELEEQASQAETANKAKEKKGPRVELEAAYAGITRNALYTMCLEKFVVTNQDNFKSQLRELTDHNIIKTKKTKQGHELLCTTFRAAELQSLLQSCEGIEV
ncbi:Origin recognition complex subunit 2 [Phlyctochytrium planicorne]|nr:Origin recognition complex subunit 2 [Phlyctochytrium planicorne]